VRREPSRHPLSGLAGGPFLAWGVVPVSAPLGFTANNCLDIGTDLGSPVSVDYYDKAPFKFNGKIGKVHVKPCRDVHLQGPEPGRGRASLSSAL
jgi:hypothetical protein